MHKPKIIASFSRDDVNLLDANKQEHKLVRRLAEPLFINSLNAKSKQNPKALLRILFPNGGTLRREFAIFDPTMFEHIHYNSEDNTMAK